MPTAVPVMPDTELAMQVPSDFQGWLFHAKAAYDRLGPTGHFRNSGGLRKSLSE